MKLIWVGGWFGLALYGSSCIRCWLASVSLFWAGLSISVRIGSDKERELKDWTMYLGWIIISDEELAYYMFVQMKRVLVLCQLVLVRLFLSNCLCI